jgi:hypothetical protein
VGRDADLAIPTLTENAKVGQASTCRVTRFVGKGDQEVEVLEDSVGSKYVDGVMAEDKRERFFLCSMSNGRFLASVVYLPVSKFEGEGGPRFLPVRGRTWRLWGPPYEQRIGRRHSSRTLPAARNFLFAPEQYYWVAGLMPPVGRDFDLVLPDRLVRRDDGLAIPGFAENVKVGQPPALGVG